MKFFRFFLLITHLVVLAMLLATLLNAIIPPSFFPYLNFLSLFFPVLMIGNILLVLIWATMKKKRVFFFIICSLFLITPTRRWVNFSFKKEKSENPTIKLLTFNTKNGNAAHNTDVAQFIKETHPDVVLLQESNINKLKLSDSYSSYYSPSGITNIFAKSKILDSGDILHAEIGRPGNVSFADVEINGKTIRFISVYLNSFLVLKNMVAPSKEMEENEEKYKTLGGKMVKNFKIHEEELKKIIPFVKNSPYPVVLTGDLNAVPNSYEYYQLNKILKDTFLESGNGFSTSFHDYKFPIRLDYVWTSESIKSVSYRVDRTVKISDHYPVIVELEIQ